MRTLSKSHNHKMKRLSTMIEPMIASSARARGFTIGRILSQWHEIVGFMSSWCRPDAVFFSRDSRTDGTLRLQIASGRGPQAQAMSQIIIDRVNAYFGYQAINRISLVQTLAYPDQSKSTQPRLPEIDQPDIWALDDKLKDIKSPELRAALRRLGSPNNADNGASGNPTGPDHHPSLPKAPSD